MKAFVARYPFLVFATLTLGYQFAIVLGVKSMLADGQLVHEAPDAHMLFRMRLFGPLIFSVALTMYLEGTAGLKKLFGPFFYWKVPATWYSIAFFWKFVIGYAGVLAAGLLFTQWPEWSMVPRFWTGWGGNLVFLIGIAIVEETGWISFSLSRMQSRFNAFTSVMIVGACWTMWYLPM